MHFHINVKCNLKCTQLQKKTSEMRKPLVAIKRNIASPKMKKCGTHGWRFWGVCVGAYHARWSTWQVERSALLGRQVTVLSDDNPTSVGKSSICMACASLSYEIGNTPPTQNVRRHARASSRPKATANQSSPSPRAVCAKACQCD